jgi:hypothetical protein
MSIARSGSRRILALFLASVPVLTAPAVSAQTATATITGTITDSTGAVVPGAQVSIVARGTGLTYQGTTASDGSYTVPLLPVGSYDITVSATGFGSYKQTAVTLDVGQRFRTDASLQVGGSQETVTVTSTTAPLQTDESSVGNVIEGRAIQELPLNGRQPFTLVLLVPGVQTTSRGSNGFADASNQGFSRLRINGGSTTGNQFLLDGAMDTIPTINEVSVVPMVDSIAEFRVITNTPSAEFGLSSGGYVNLATKTGTNDLHLTAYEFVRNDVLNAVNRFATKDPITGRLKPILRYNQFGGTIGGPVRIPWLYNGHDRSFFFFGYEQWHQRSASLQRSTVPTPLQRAGDFSQTYASATSTTPIPIYNPATTMANPAGNGFVRTQFAGNRITTFDPVALAVLKYIPLPNIAPVDPKTNANNFYSEATGGIDQDVIAARVDHRLRSSDNIFVRYAGNLNTTHTVGFGLGDSDPLARNDTRKNYNLAIGETHTFSSTLLNEFRASFVRQVLTFLSPSYNKNYPQALGFPAIIPQTLFPSISVSGIISTGPTTGTFTAGNRIGTVIQFADTVSWIRGRHSLKFGIEDHVTRYNQLGQIYPSGNFSFTGTYTSNPQSPAGTGVAIADFLLGQVNGGQLTINPAFATKAWAGGVFIQDDIKISPRLTLNVGLRYDVSGPPVERHGWSSTFDPYLVNTQTGLPGVLRYAGVNGSRLFVRYDANNIAPRFGFAYSVDDKTVVRGGAALIYNPVESADIHQTTNTGLGFSSQTTFSGSGPNPAFQLSKGPAALIAPAGASGGPTAYRGQAVFYQNPNAPTPYSLQWNLSVQRQLPGGWTASAAYVGNKGTHLLGGNYNIDTLNPAYYAQYGSRLQNLVPNPFFGKISTGSLAGSTITQQQALLPLPDYLSVTTLARHGAMSIYHALQATAEHRYAHGVTVLLAYSKSKLINDSTSSDSGESTDGTFRDPLFHPGLERSLDPTDTSQNLSGSGVWQLPIGTPTHRVLNLVTGGWQLQGIVQWQTGTPLSVTGSNNFTGTPFPDLTGNPTLSSDQRSINRWFNTAAFANPAPYTIGNAPRTLRATRGPGFTNVNASLIKNVNFEKWTLELRGEGFNIFNHPQLNNPNTSFSPNSSGVNTNALFGTITSALDPRVFQIGIHLSR